METAIVVALITGTFGIIGQFIVARRSQVNVQHTIETNLAVQNEKFESYQRQTNEKIDELRRDNKAQQEWGTRIALLEADAKRHDAEMILLREKIEGKGDHHEK